MWRNARRQKCCSFSTYIYHASGMSKWLVALAVILLLVLALIVGGRGLGLTRGGGFEQGGRFEQGGGFEQGGRFEQGGGFKPGCTQVHADKVDGGLQYPWLDGIHGGLAKTEYEEPVDSGVWRDYTKKIWEIHCRVVSHDPKNLVEAHIRAFVEPENRFARLRFTFRDGAVVASDDAVAFRRFYEMERNWFATRM
jgi:hypothetical protein